VKRVKEARSGKRCPSGIAPRGEGARGKRRIDLLVTRGGGKSKKEIWDMERRKTYSRAALYREGQVSESAGGHGSHVKITVQYCTVQCFFFTFASILLLMSECQLCSNLL
jgi:hypothetical protein